METKRLREINMADQKSVVSDEEAKRVKDSFNNTGEGFSKFKKKAGEFVDSIMGTPTPDPSPIKRRINRYGE
jgi:hypothetical protein